MVPYLAKGNEQATLSLLENQFGSDPYLNMHVGHENPAKSFGQIITGIDNPRDVFHDNLSLAAIPEWSKGFWV